MSATHAPSLAPSLVRHGSHGDQQEQRRHGNRLLHASDTEALRTLSLAERAGLGAAGGIAASCFCHPLDVVRVQMQVAQYGGTFDAIKSIFNRGGFGGL